MLLTRKRFYDIFYKKIGVSTKNNKLFTAKVLQYIQEFPIMCYKNTKEMGEYNDKKQ